MRTNGDVSREVTRILERAGLNPDGTLAVVTGFASYRFETRIEGVNPQLARAALDGYMADRRRVSLRDENGALVLTQWDR